MVTSSGAHSINWINRHWKLEKVLRRATKLLPQLKDLDYMHRLKALKLPSPQYRKQRGNMIETLKIITGRVRLDHTLFFTFVSDTSRHGHINKLYNQHAPRRVRVQSFGIRIMNEWNNLRWVVKAEDFDKFKHNLDTHWHARQYLTPAYFSLISSFMESSLFGTRTKSTTVRGCSVELKGSLTVGIPYTLVFLICLMCWGGCLFLKGDRRLYLFCFFQIINGLAKCP